MIKPASLVHGVPDTTRSEGHPEDAPPVHTEIQPKHTPDEGNDDISIAAEAADADDVELELADDSTSQPEPAPAKWRITRGIRRRIKRRIRWKRVLAYGVLPG